MTSFIITSIGAYVWDAVLVFGLAMVFYKAIDLVHSVARYFNALAGRAEAQAELIDIDAENAEELLDDYNNELSERENDVIEREETLNSHLNVIETLIQNLETALKVATPNEAEVSANASDTVSTSKDNSGQASQSF